MLAISPDRQLQLTDHLLLNTGSEGKSVRASGSTSRGKTRRPVLSRKGQPGLDYLLVVAVTCSYPQDECL